MTFCSLARILSAFSLSTGDARGDGSSGFQELWELGKSIAGLFGFAILKVKKLITWAKQNHAPQFGKILVTYFLVLGSFTMFTIEWPDIALTMIVRLKGLFKFEVLQMPGLSCVLQSYSSFTQALHLYTIGPLIFLALFLLPVAAAVLRGYYRHSRDGLEEGYRWYVLVHTTHRNIECSGCDFSPRLVFVHVPLGVCY